MEVAIVTATTTAEDTAAERASTALSEAIGLAYPRACIVCPIPADSSKTDGEGGPACIACGEDPITPCSLEFIHSPATQPDPFLQTIRQRGVEGPPGHQEESVFVPLAIP